MKLIMVFLVALSLTFTPIASFAKPGGKGKAKDPQPNESAYEHSSEKARFKRGDDNQEDQGVFLRGKDDDSDVLKDGNKNSDIDDVATDEVQTKGKKAKKTKDEVKTKSKKVEKTTDDSEGVVEERTKEQKKERIDRSERDQERKARKLERKEKKNKRKDIED